MEAIKENTKRSGWMPWADLFFTLSFVLTVMMALPALAALSTTGKLTRTKAVAVINATMHIENLMRPNVDGLIAAIDDLGGAGIPLSLGADIEWVTGEPRAAEVLSAVVAWGGALDAHAHDFYMDEEGGVHVYNRADAANAIGALGFDVTAVCSGYNPDEVAELSYAYAPFLGGESWEASYLWGLSEPGHGYDDTSWGITRDGSGGPPHIGGGETTIASAETMAKAVRAGTYSGMLLTSAVMIRPESLTVVNSTDTVVDVVAFKSRSDVLRARWLTLQATGELADSAYPGIDSRVESTQ